MDRSPTPQLSPNRPGDVTPLSKTRTSLQIETSSSDNSQCLQRVQAFDFQQIKPLIGYTYRDISGPVGCHRVMGYTQVTVTQGKCLWKEHLVRWEQDVSTQPDRAESKNTPSMIIS